MFGRNNFTFMIYIARFFFLLALIIYRTLFFTLMIPGFFIGYPIACFVYYVIKGNIDGLESSVDSFEQHIWDWILKFDPDKAGVSFENGMLHFDKTLKFEPDKE